MTDTSFNKVAEGVKSFFLRKDQPSALERALAKRDEFTRTAKPGEMLILEEDEMKALVEHDQRHMARADAQAPMAQAANPPELLKHDPVNHPVHYTSHPSGVECIDITEHMGFNLGNAVKYIWRADLKNGTEDLEKARWYLNREIQRRSPK